MIGRDFTGYKEVARITNDLVSFALRTESITPVADYLHINKIYDYNSRLKVLKVARAVGMDVYIKQGQWFEKGMKINEV